MTNNKSHNLDGVKDDIANAEAPAIPAHPSGWPLPPDCPVTPLGHCDDRFFYLDSCDQIVALKSEKHTRLGVESLFLKDFGWLKEHYARYLSRLTVGERLQRALQWNPAQGDPQC